MTDDAKRVTSAVLATLKKGGDNLSIYQAVSAALAATPAVGEECAGGVQPAAAQEALRLLRKISDLAYDADVGEPLDCAIDYANKAIAVLTAPKEPM